jgi:pimeloyl-ACP methyl ester carboxylesterase
MRYLAAFVRIVIVLALLPLSAVAAGTAATAQTRQVVVNGDRIAYRDIGRGTPIVLANRMRGTLDTWDPLFLDELARRHRVITFDFPGVGYSSGQLPEDIAATARVVRDFASVLRLDSYVAAGWSWGGLVVQALAVDHPERITRVVLIGTNPPGPPQVPIKQVFLDRAFRPYNDLADDEVLFFEPASAASRAAAKRSRERIYARPGVADRIPSTPEQISAYLAAAKSFHEDREGRRAAFARLQVPVLVLCGDNDPSTPAQNWFPLVGEARKAALVVLPDAGHAPQHQYPELSARYVEEFLRANR